ncbi:MAG: hypothetical protein AAGB01_05905 [Cyanobacteria bacterium P01_F01_bin.42]
MLALFPLERKGGRWKLLSLCGLGLLVYAHTPNISAQDRAISTESQLPSTDALEVEPQGFRQSDDLLRDRESPWPPMTPAQIEQTRTTLIREGFSPMEADTILPAAR